MGGREKRRERKIHSSPLEKGSPDEQELPQIQPLVREEYDVFGDAQENDIRKLGLEQAAAKERSLTEKRNFLQISREQLLEREHTPEEIKVLDDRIDNIEKAEKFAGLIVKRRNLEKSFEAKEALSLSDEKFGLLQTPEGLEALQEESYENISLDQVLEKRENKEIFPSDLIEKRTDVLLDEVKGTYEWKSLCEAHKYDDNWSEAVLEKNTRAYLKTKVVDYYVDDKESVGLVEVLEKIEKIEERILKKIENKIRERETAKNEFENSKVADEMHRSIRTGNIDTSVADIIKNKHEEFDIRGIGSLKGLSQDHQKELYKNFCGLTGSPYDEALEGEELVECLLQEAYSVQRDFSSKMSGLLREQSFIGGAGYLQGVFGGSLPGEKALYEDVEFGFGSMKVNGTGGEVTNVIDFQGVPLSYTINPDGSMSLYNQKGEESEKICCLSPSEIAREVSQDSLSLEEIGECDSREALEGVYSKIRGEKIMKLVSGKTTHMMVGREKVFDAVHVQSFGTRLDSILELDSKRGHIVTKKIKDERLLFIDTIYKDHTITGRGFSQANSVLQSKEFMYFAKALPPEISVREFMQDAGLVGYESIALESGGVFFDMGWKRLGDFVGAVNDTKDIQFGDLVDFAETSGSTDFRTKYEKILS